MFTREESFRMHGGLHIIALGVYVACFFGAVDEFKGHAIIGDSPLPMSRLQFYLIFIPLTVLFFLALAYRAATREERKRDAEYEKRRIREFETNPMNYLSKDEINALGYFDEYQNKIHSFTPSVESVKYSPEEMIRQYAYLLDQIPDNFSNRYARERFIREFTLVSKGFEAEQRVANILKRSSLPAIRSVVIGNCENDIITLSGNELWTIEVKNRSYGDLWLTESGILLKKSRTGYSPVSEEDNFYLQSKVHKERLESFLKDSYERGIINFVPEVRMMVVNAGDCNVTVDESCGLKVLDIEGFNRWVTTVLPSDDSAIITLLEASKQQRRYTYSFIDEMKVYVQKKEFENKAYEEYVNTGHKKMYEDVSRKVNDLKRTLQQKQI